MYVCLCDFYPIDINIQTPSCFYYSYYFPRFYLCCKIYAENLLLTLSCFIIVLTAEALWIFTMYVSVCVYVGISVCIKTESATTWLSKAVLLVSLVVYYCWRLLAYAEIVNYFAHTCKHMCALIHIQHECINMEMCVQILLLAEHNCYVFV